MTIEEEIIKAAQKLVKSWYEPMIDAHGYANSARFSVGEEAKWELIQAIDKFNEVAE